MDRLTGKLGTSGKLRIIATALLCALAGAGCASAGVGDPCSPESSPEGGFDAVLLDPPRSGAGAVLGRIAATGARRIVYVSCNPETLAEDAAALVQQHGYRLAAAGAMDMFPQTTHIEAMTLFERP